MAAIILLFSIIFFCFLIVLLFICAVSSDLSRQEEWEEALRKFKDCNKK